MAKIKPFLCIRPAADKASRIAALPYDVYNREEAKTEVAKEPLSFLRIDRAETQLDDTVDTYDDQVYQKAHDLLWQMIEDETFVREDRERYYIYEMTMAGRVQDGLVACAAIDDYLNGIIKKHENTRKEKEQDRIRHVDACNAQTGPIFLAYRAKKEINAVIAEAKKRRALYDFTSPDGIRHRVFAVDQPEEIASVREAFDNTDQIYIADGHHRAASAVKVGLKRRQEHPGYTGEEEFNYFLSVLFADEQLLIMDYNRVVKDLNGYSPEEFLGKVCEFFNVEKIGQFPEDVAQEYQKQPKASAVQESRKPSEADVVQNGQAPSEINAGQEGCGIIRPRKKGEFSMYLAGTWYRCQIRNEDQNSDPVEGLDVSLLQKLLLEPILGIGDPRTDNRIDFVGGIRGLTELERRVSEDCAVAFAMYPTSIQELFAVADAGMLMPPKSTWFEPKLRSGLFIHEI